MAYSDDLSNLRNRYYNCVNQLCKTANDLQKSMGAIQHLINEQKGCYLVDDVNVGESYLTGLIEKEKGIFNNIVNNILPGTYNIIDNLSLQISDAIYQEELEAMEVLE
ncbi:hypothetical protein IKE96_02390 [bacterium]|nr:hypothetical protein [bacterium]